MKNFDLATYRAKHRDYRGRMEDGRRNYLELCPETGATVLIIEPTPPDADRPEPGKQYRLTGGRSTPSIMQGDTWAASEVKPE